MIGYPIHLPFISVHFLFNMPHSLHHPSHRSRVRLNSLITAIEQQLGWGDANHWTGSDFERLSDLIYDRTQQRLSVTTLKRTWGRTSQVVQPSSTTLNILARFLGHESWRAFHSVVAEPELVSDANPAAAHSFRKVSILVGSIAAVLIALLTIYSLTSPESAPIDTSKVSFSIEKVTSGIPNTVVFRYDLGGQAVDTLELQQSWDERKRTLLDPNRSLVTTTYLSPGYFNAKLVADDVILKTENLYLQSDGFEVLVSMNDKGQAQLLDQEYWSINQDGFVLSNSFDSTFDMAQVQNMLLMNLLPEPLIKADSFAFKTSFRMHSKGTEDPCHATTFIITGAEEVYMFSMGHPGCAGKFSAFLGGLYIDGKNADLSAMGFNLEEWTDITVSKQDSVVTFQVNDRSMTLTNKSPSIGPLGGIRFFTQEKIQIKQLNLEDSNQEIDLIGI